MKIKFHPSIQSLSGTMGEWVYYTLNGQPVARRKAEFVDKRSQGQLAHRERVRLAAAWSRKTMADPKQKADYLRACQGHQTPYNLGFRDFMSPPVIELLDLEGYKGKAGDRIRIKARDDFEVVQVPVAIKDAEGQVIEEGPAKWNGPKGYWEYLTKKNVTGGKSVLVEISAIDRPGNKTESSGWQHFPEGD